MKTIHITVRGSQAQVEKAINAKAQEENCMLMANGFAVRTDYDQHWINSKGHKMTQANLTNGITIIVTNPTMQEEKDEQSRIFWATND